MFAAMFFPGCKVTYKIPETRLVKLIISKTVQWLIIFKKSFKCFEPIVILIIFAANMQCHVDTTYKKCELPQIIFPTLKTM